MKAAVYYSQSDIRIEELPTPKIENGEILVQMKACGVCGTDLMSWYLERRAPLILGHEPAGVVVEKGSSVEGFDVGDRVFVHHHVACLNCHYCLRGDFTLCRQFHETKIDPGGFSEYFRVPNPNVRLDTHKIPESLTFDESTLIEPVGCCLRALKKCSIQEGDFVAIIGAGTTGLIHTALSKIMGARKTIVTDLFDYRLSFAKKFGADATVNPKNSSLSDIVKAETDKRGVDLAVVTAPNLDAYRTALGVCRNGGKLCVFAPTNPHEAMQLSPKDLFFSEVQIVPSYSTSHVETKQALELLVSGKLKVKELITHRFGLEEASEAFKAALDSKESLKVLLINE